jgi:hypothetical protein
MKKALLAICKTEKTYIQRCCKNAECTLVSGNKQPAGTNVKGNIVTSQSPVIVDGVFWQDKTFDMPELIVCDYLADNSEIEYPVICQNNTNFDISDWIFPEKEHVIINK